MAVDAPISIDFVYAASAGDIHELNLQLPAGTKAARALVVAFEQLSMTPPVLDNGSVGIWGKKVHPGHVLKTGDRLELYRPLTVDPKVARKERFAKQGTRKVPGLFAQRRPGAKPGY